MIESFKAIAQAINSADIVLSTGGVSVRDYDYVDRILAKLGETLHIRSVAVKPGKPLTVASFDNNYLYWTRERACWEQVDYSRKRSQGDVS